MVENKENVIKRALTPFPVVNIVISPPATVAQGNYAFNLHITSSNHAARDIPIYVAVTASGVGDVLFKASDIFTATLDAAGNPIYGLAGASIRIQNEKVLSIDHTLTTDALGEVLFTGLAAGQYKFRATAANHQEAAGRLWVKPGITVAQDVFLDYDLVSVTWSVTPVTINDQYQVNLDVTYETNVPAAVVVIEPAGINLPIMQPGDVFSGEFVMTNYGLVRADNVAFTLPASNQYFKYELLLDAVPTSLDAKQVVTIPYRVTMLSSAATTGTSTGGGCWGHTDTVQVIYEYWCANGTNTDGSTGYSFSYSDSSTCSSGGNNGGGGTPPPPSSGGFGGGGSSGGSGGGGTGGYTPSYGSLSGLPVCMPDCPDGTCGSGGKGSGDDR